MISKNPESPFERPKSPKGPKNLEKRHWNERKFEILKIVSEFTETIGGARTKDVARELKIPLAHARILMKRYADENHGGYLKRRQILMTDVVGVTKRGQPPYLYELTEKGLKWLVKAQALLDQGLPPDLGRYGGRAE